MADPDWDLFRLFFKVAEAGSVNKASALLNISQPTLSRRLGELERHLGAPLFFRTPAGVRLTREGRELYSSAESVFSTFESFRRDIRERLGARASVIRISTSEGMTRHWLMPRIARLRQQIPGVCVEVDASVRQQSLTGSDLDYVIRLGDPGEGDLIGRQAGELAFGFFAAQSYVDSHAMPADLAAMTHHDLVGGTADGGTFRNLSPGDLALLSELRALLASRAVVRLSPMTAQHAAVAQGLGIALLAVPFARAEGLVRVLPDVGLAAGVWLLRRKESNLRRLTREVGRFLEAELRGSQAWLAGVER